MKTLNINKDEKVLLNPDQGYEIADQWFCFTPKTVVTSTSSFNSTIARFSLIDIRKKYTFKSIGVFITGGASAGRLLKLGIYKNNSDNKPDLENLLYDFPIIDCATSGEKIINLSENIVMNPGFYWVGFSANAGVILQSINGNTAYFDIFGNSTITNSSICSYQCNYTYNGDLPNTILTLTAATTEALLFMQTA
ncbi:hypothetical protein [Nostoc phage N1]|nr:hypothetical protein [Nostoc phage N1]